MRLMRTVADDSAYKILRIRPLTGALGAEISGVDLSKPLTAAAREEIKRALYDHLVIYCHDQEGFSRELHLEFAQMFGKLQKIPHIFSVDGYPDVQMVRREPGESRRYVGEGFHIDSTFLKTPPTTVTMHCIDAPEVGGDTAFANLQLAYDTLSPAMKKFVGGYSCGQMSTAPRAWFGPEGVGSGHTSLMKDMAAASEGDEMEVTKPRRAGTHPGSGRKGLFVARRLHAGCLEGFEEQESAGDSVIPL